MRRKLIAGNWKMNELKKQGLALAQAVTGKCQAGLPFDVLICPPMSLLGLIASKPHPFTEIGAQDIAETPEISGAFTGDISAEMVKDLGATHTIVGHSERRALHHETDAVVRQKAQNAIHAGLTAVICIGETKAERDSHQALQVVTRQIQNSVPPEATDRNCVIAYEPVWAIGTGKTPTTADVAQMHAVIRKELAVLLGRETSDKIRILYGGSVKPANAKELLAVENVDGALIGGASLKIEDFWGIMQTQL